MIYYNDFDPDIIKWLNRLSNSNLIKADKIDGRSILDVKSADIENFTRCHFFAGIGGWELALQMAKWPYDEEIWTASLPCQPWSNVGKHKGFKDERHLWPVFKTLVEKRRPKVVVGEQVSSKSGREWLDRVQTEMETLGYAFAAADLCSACVGSPSIRQRLYWVACSDYKGVDSTFGKGLEGHSRNVSDRNESRWKQTHKSRPISQTSWNSYDIIKCIEPTKEPGRFVEKRRRIESGTESLATRLPKGMELSTTTLLKGYGNSICPQVAEVFIRSFMECKKLNS